MLSEGKDPYEELQNLKKNQLLSLPPLFDSQRSKFSMGDVASPLQPLSTINKRKHSMIEKTHVPKSLTKVNSPFTMTRYSTINKPHATPISLNTTESFFKKKK